MRIDKSNCEIINSKEIYIHDSMFNDVVFDYQKKVLYVSILKNKIIEFHNVIGYYMTACDYWGEGPFVLDWELSDKFLLTEKLFMKTEDSIGNQRLNNKEKFFETVIILASGDKLIIACEYIIFDNK